MVSMEIVKVSVLWTGPEAGDALDVIEEPQPRFVGRRKLGPRADALVELDSESGEETGNVREE
jgi:hypothetical protein